MMRRDVVGCGVVLSVACLGWAGGAAAQVEAAVAVGEPVSAEALVGEAWHARWSPEGRPGEGDEMSLVFEADGALRMLPEGSLPPGASVSWAIDGDELVVAFELDGDTDEQRSTARLAGEGVLLFWAAGEDHDPIVLSREGGPMTDAALAAVGVDASSGGSLIRSIEIRSVSTMVFVQAVNGGMPADTAALLAALDVPRNEALPAGAFVPGDAPEGGWSDADLVERFAFVYVPPAGGARDYAEAESAVMLYERPELAGERPLIVVFGDAGVQRLSRLELSALLEVQTGEGLAGE